LYCKRGDLKLVEVYSEVTMFGVRTEKLLLRRLRAKAKRAIKDSR